MTVDRLETYWGWWLVAGGGNSDGCSAGLDFTAFRFLWQRIAPYCGAIWIGQGYKAISVGSFLFGWSPYLHHTHPPTHHHSSLPPKPPPLHPYPNSVCSSLFPIGRKPLPSRLLPRDGQTKRRQGAFVFFHASRECGCHDGRCRLLNDCDC